MNISKIRLAHYSVPLPQVLRLGTTAITTRDYVALRLETDSGLFGEALGYPRGTPLFDTANLMAAQVLGKDASMRRQVMTDLESRNIPGRAALTRSLSLFDIALWDIACKQAGQPLYRHLGACRSEAEVTAVAGYYMDRRPIADIADEVSALLDEGYHRAKVMLKGDDPAFDREYVAAVTRAGAGKVAADAHWSWSSITEAMRLCRDIDTMGLDFLEDPFAANDIQLTRELQPQLATPHRRRRRRLRPARLQRTRHQRRHSPRRRHHLRRHHRSHRSHPHRLRRGTHRVPPRLRAAPHPPRLRLPPRRSRRVHLQPNPEPTRSKQFCWTRPPCFMEK